MTTITVICIGQEKSIKVHGYLIDEKTGIRLTDILVINKRNGSFTYGDSLGNFKINIWKKDILIFSANGYASSLFSLSDSIQKESYFITPVLNPFQIFLNEVLVSANRKIGSIKKELDKINEIEKIQETSSLISPINPISFLYYKFSKKEKRKRKIEKLKFENIKITLLKELFNQHMSIEPIKLTDKEIETFIYQLDLSYRALNFSSEYEMLTYIKKEFEKWNLGVEKE